MKVVMLKTGEIKEAAVGYARNYLFPKKLAIAATTESIKNAEEKRKRLALDQENKKKAEEEMMSKLKNLVIKIIVKSNAEGKLFAALGASEIIKAVKEQIGLDINETWIKMPSKPIKEIGEYDLEIINTFGNKTKLKIQLNK